MQQHPVWVKHSYIDTYKLVIRILEHAAFVAVSCPEVVDTQTGSTRTKDIALPQLDNDPALVVVASCSGDVEDISATLQKYLPFRRLQVKTPHPLVRRRELPKRRLRCKTVDLTAVESADTLDIPPTSEYEMDIGDCFGQSSRARSAGASFAWAGSSGSS